MARSKRSNPGAGRPAAPIPAAGPPLEPSADGPPAGKKKRASRRPRSAWTDKSPAERSQTLVDAHAQTVEKVKTEAAAKGCPNHWDVHTTWVADFDAPFSVIGIGLPDPEKHEEIVEAWAEFLISTWIHSKGCTTLHEAMLKPPAPSSPPTPADVPVSVPGGKELRLSIGL